MGDQAWEDLQQLAWQLSRRAWPSFPPPAERSICWHTRRSTLVAAIVRIIPAGGPAFIQVVLVESSEAST